MLIFRVIVFAFLIALLGGFYWLTGRYLFLWGIDSKTRGIRISRIGLSLLLGLGCLKWRMTGLIAVHFISVFAVLELVAFFFRRTNRSKSGCPRLIGRIYRSGVLPVLLTGLLLGYGFHNMIHIVKTEYTVTSDKLSRDYEIVLITDTHYDTIQDPAILKDAVNDIRLRHPDIVVLGGDIVEEGTSKEAMEEVFAMFGNIESTCGVYYVYGNHDRQLYTNHRSYTEEDLVNAIEKSGIVILNDRLLTLNEDIVLAGREDAAKIPKRISAAELLNGTDKSQFLIVADHQPVEIKENAALGVDLVLSGHTHAGQLFPIGLFNELTGLNYGAYQIGDCTAIVSSGTTGWGFPIRTQKHCEYVVISLKKI